MSNGVRSLIDRLRFHGWIVIVALLASAHVMLPAIVGSIVAGPADQGVYVSDNSDWAFYVARIRDVSEGHRGANPYLAEHANDVYPNIPALETVIAFFVRTFKIDPVQLQIALDAIMPFLITILFYAVLSFLSRSRWISAGIPSFLIWTNIWSLDKPIHLQLSLPFLLLFLWGWLYALSLLDRRDSSLPFTGKEKRVGLLILGCGILLGAIFFTYFIDWTFLYVLLVTVALVSFLFRRRDVSLLSAGIIAFSLPFGIVYVQLMSRVFAAPWYQDLAPRLGVTLSHLPEMIPRTSVALAACAFFFLFMRYAKITKSAVAQGVFALLLANVIYPNHNVLTGRSFQNAAHWVFQPIFLFSLAATFVYPFLKLPREQVTRAGKIGAAGVILVFLAASMRLSSFLPAALTYGNIENFLTVQRYGPIFRYLQQSTPADSVVFTDEELSYLIPAYTHDRVYFLRFLTNLPSSDREMAERYLLASQFDPDFFGDQNLGITPGHQLLWENYYHIDTVSYYRFWPWKLESKYTVEDERRYVRGVLQDMTSSGGLSFERMRTYRLDYVVWDKKRFPQWAVDRMHGLEKLFEENEIVVYGVPPKR